MALEAAAYLAMRQRDYALAAPRFEEALEIFRELDDRREIARTLRHYGILPTELGQFERAQALLEESASILRSLGDLSGVSMTLHNLGDLASDRGDEVRARAAYQESVALGQQVGNRHATAYALRGLGHLARTRGEFGQAVKYLRESLTLLRPLRDVRCTPLSLEGLACITAGPGWAERAARLLGAAQAMQARTGTPSPPSAMADYERTVADARAALGEARFDATWKAGGGMSLGEAVAYALSAEAASAAPDPAVLVDERQAATTEAAEAPVRPLQPERRGAIPLSAREVEVVSLIAQGLSNREIANRLILSVRTVERHIENVYNRLGISGKAGRAIVTAYALRHELVAPA
jgi:non-specific serine/threonine protein kinase